MDKWVEATKSEGGMPRSHRELVVEFTSVLHILSPMNRRICMETHALPWKEHF